MTKEEALAELEEVKQKLRNPKGSLFGTRKLYRRMSELYAIIDAEDANADSHSTGR